MRYWEIVADSGISYWAMPESFNEDEVIDYVQEALDEQVQAIEEVDAGEYLAWEQEQMAFFTTD